MSNLIIRTAATIKCKVNGTGAYGDNVKFGWRFFPRLPQICASAQTIVSLQTAPMPCSVWSTYALTG